MTIAPEADIARTEGDQDSPVPVLGPISRFPRLDLDMVEAEPKPEPRKDDKEGPAPSPAVEKATAQFDTPEESPPGSGKVARLGAWLSARWNGLIGHMSDAAFMTGLLGSGLGQLSYWATKFPFVMALSFALTFEMAMVGISRRVRNRRIQELPAGALHTIGWGAALGASGWNLIHLSDPTVVVRFAWINGGAPLFTGGPVVGASFATLALIGFLIHEQSEKYYVEDALAAKGRKIQRIGAARFLNYPRVSWKVWRTKIADPSVDVDAEFLKVLNGQRGEKVLSEVETSVRQVPVVTRQVSKASGRKPQASSPAVRGKSRAELERLAPAVAVAERDENDGQRLGFRRLQTRFSLTQADARELRTLADEAAKKQSA